MDTNVIGCMLGKCLYNDNRKCRARIISIGDGDHPRCDTFIIGKSKGGDTKTMGRVGDCKVIKCSYNDSQKCTVKNIDVGLHDQHADCLTFKAV